MDQSVLDAMVQRLQTKKNLILQGPPGTGKTWLAKRLAYALVGRKDARNVWPMQFHPNLAYEDFVRGWRPQGDAILELVDGPFLQMVEQARTDADAVYVMVIEEINRGNPASVFGEMLTLLEADKRSADEALALAYPDEAATIQGHRIRFATVDLVADTPILRRQLLRVVDGEPGDGAS